MSSQQGMKHRVALTLCASLLAGAAHAVAPGTSVNDFALLDQNGKFHHLYYLSDAKAVVLMAHDNECAATRDAVIDLEEIKTTFAARGVEFMMINVDDSRESIAAQIKQTGSTIPVLVDETQLVGESLQLQRAGEVLVIDPKGWKLAYRGPLAAKAIDAVLAGKAVKSPRASAKGCALKLNTQRDLTGKNISYANQIAPLLADNCVTCHRTGGIGPFPMNRTIVG